MKQELDVGEVKVPVAGQGSALNPLHPVNRITGLSEGRRWRIALFDPTAVDLGKALGPEIGGLLKTVESVRIPVLEAEVTTDTLAWDGDEVPCFKVEYREPGKQELLAATWVRRRDGLVLQQHSKNDLLELELTLRRVPRK